MKLMKWSAPKGTAQFSLTHDYGKKSVHVMNGATPVMVRTNPEPSWIPEHGGGRVLEPFEVARFEGESFIAIRPLGGAASSGFALVEEGPLSALGRQDLQEVVVP